MKLVFDVGATHIRIAAVEGSTIGEVIRLETDRSAAGLPRFLGALQEVAAGRKPTAVAGGVPGQFNPKTGLFEDATNLPEWEGLPVGERIKEQFDCPTWVTNDVVMGGLGEATAGAGSKTGVMAYFTLSTGVNAVRLVDGRVDESISPYEIGKQLIPSGDGVKSLETLVGGAAFAARKGVSPHDVRDGRTWRAEERHLAHGLYNTCLHWTPQVVVFGGSMMRDVDLDEVAAQMRELPPVMSMLPELRRSTLGDAAGLHGALAWITQHT